MNKKLMILGLMTSMALSAAACGRMADLESPRPKTERAMRGAGDDNLPEPATVNRPNREMPMDGGITNPYDGAGNRPQH